jgi:hypothetical protein
MPAYAPGLFDLSHALRHPTSGGQMNCDAGEAALLLNSLNSLDALIEIKSFKEMMPRQCARNVTISDDSDPLWFVQQAALLVPCLDQLTGTSS